MLALSNGRACYEIQCDQYNKDRRFFIKVTMERQFSKSKRSVPLSRRLKVAHQSKL